MTLCGPAGCQHSGNTDTVLILYRNVPAGDPLTANGGLSGVFNPASTCTNARGLQDDLGISAGITNNPGGLRPAIRWVGGSCIGTLYIAVKREFIIRFEKTARQREFYSLRFPDSPQERLGN